MYYEIYIDVVFATNLLMDYLLLRFVGNIFRCRVTRKRTFLAAISGALFSCLILYIPTDAFLPVQILLNGACALGMISLGCRLRKNGLLFKATVTLYLTAFLCGGFWEVMSAKSSITLKTFLLFAAVTYMGLSALVYVSDSFRVRLKNIYPVTLSYQGKVQPSYGFYDTGNLLTDPVNGKPVSVVKPDFLEAVLSENLTEKLKNLRDNPGELQSTEIARLQPRFLPYETVGKKGMLLAITLEKLCIQTPREEIQVERPVVAIAEEPFALSKECKVLLNFRLLEE